MSDSATWWPAALQVSLSFTVSLSFLKPMSIESVIPSNHPILCQPLLHLPSIFPSIRVFSIKLALHIMWPKLQLHIRWPKLQHQSFRCIFRADFLKDWLVWPACCPRDSQESSPAPQFKSINSSAFFMVHLSHPYMTTGKTIALTIWNFVGQVMSLLFKYTV